MKQSSIALLCTTGLMLTSAGISVATPAVAQAASQPLLLFGSRGSTVATLQNKLNALGYSCGRADGVFGPKTLSAVKKFQSAKHLAVDGIVGPQTEAALNNSKPGTQSTSKTSSTAHSGSSATVISTAASTGSVIITSTPTVRYGLSGLAVKTLQTALNKLGFSCGVVDGSFGPKTLAAVKNFQRNEKLSVDGIVGPNTWSALKDTLAKTSVPAPTSRGTTADSATTSGSGAKSSSSSSTSSKGNSTSGGSSTSSSSTETKSGGSSSTSSTSSSSSSSKSGSTSAPAYPGTIVQMGSTGTAVQEVQTQLNSLGYSCGAVDGDFGPKTLAEVEAFQKAKKLTADGQVGPQTWDALFGTTTKTTPTNPTTVQTSLFSSVDLRYPAPANISQSSINSYLTSKNSPMAGLGESFMAAQSTYSVDATYLVAHAIEESASGTSQISLNDNNLFGYGAYDSNPGSDAGVFPSEDYAIRFEAWEVRYNYLDADGNNYGGAPTLTGMNVHYATDSQWAAKIGNIMGSIASSVNSSIHDYHTYTQTASAPNPAASSSIEPVYYLNGATGTTRGNSTYGGTPYYADAASGESYMFVGPLQNGSSNSGTVIVQNYLNAVNHAGLTADGQYGKLTQAAVVAFEKTQGLPADGVWSTAMWQKYIVPYIQANKGYQASVIPANATVHILQIAQGMAGGLVTPWYLLQGYGWVDSSQVTLTNVYRLTTPSSENASNSSIPVYASDGKTQIATLHAGDFVVANATTANSHVYTIQFAAQTNGASFGNHAPGTMMTGYVKDSTAKLTLQQ